MFSKPLKVTALALVSLGAACTSSESVMIGLGNESGAAGAPAAPFMPFVPSTPSPAAPVGPSGVAGTGPAFTGAGGAGGMAAMAACMGALLGSTGSGGTTSAGPVPPGAPPPSVFPLDLGGPVTSQDHAPKPISGGTLLVLRDKSTAVASDPDRDRVYVVDLASWKLRATLNLRDGDEPGRLVEDGAGLVHVALRSGGQVATIDPQAGTVLSSVAACAAPRGLAYEASRDLVHVACAEGRLVSLRARGGDRFRDVEIARDARDVVSLAAGGLLVSTFRQAEALVLDADGKVTTTMRGPRFMRAPMPIPQPVSPAVAWRMVADQNGGAYMLHQRGVDGPISPTPGGYGGVGRGCGGIVETAVTVVAPGSDMAPTPAIAMSTLAVDVALSPDGSQLAIASAGNAHTPLPQLQVVSADAVRSGSLQAGCMGAATPNATLQPPGQVVAVAYAPDGTLYAQTREPAQLISATSSTPLSLSADPLPDTGHLIFHANSGSGIACASCHPEGGEDSRVWNFACLGPRRTQSLRGGLSGTEPFHWDGDMDTFPKLVDEVFVGRMSGPKTTDAQTGALLHWLDRVPNLPVRTAGDPGAIERGRALFNGGAKCVACHMGPHLTNSNTVDVGTGSRLQVPSLLGVGWRAPFLHDGRARTLLDRFDPTLGASDMHGQTSQLKLGEVADLTAYLETL